MWRGEEEECGGERGSVVGGEREVWQGKREGVAGRGGGMWLRRVRCVVEESVDCDIAIDVHLITGAISPI